MSFLSRFSPTLIIQHTGETVKRFPLVVLTTMTSGILLYLLINSKNQTDPSLLNLFLTSLLAIPLMVSVVMMNERDMFRNKYLPLLLLLIPAGFFVLSPKEDLNSNYFRFAQLFVATHLFAGFAPYLKDKNDGRLWEFNKSIFLRFLLSTLYTSVLTGGLFICLGSLKGLFGIPISANTFLITFILCAFIFHPIHFLTGVPAKYEEINEYPRPLWVFCQNLLIPLIAVFGTILVVYGVTIVATLNWPKGLITLLVSTFSVVGMLTIVLIDPLIRNDKSWFRKFSSYFYLAQILLACLMLAAIYRRTAEYGVTESRYVVILVSAWLILIGLFFLIRKNQTLKLIPMSLCVLTLITTYGPWSAHSVSLRSEKKRLEKILTEYQVLVKGKLNKDHKVLPYKVGNDISSLILYIYNHHGSAPVADWITDKSKNRQQFYVEANLPEYYSNSQYFSFNDPMLGDSITIAGYKKLTSFNLMPNTRKDIDHLSLRLNTGSLEIYSDDKLVLKKTTTELMKLSGITNETRYSGKKILLNVEDPRLMLWLTSGSGNMGEEKDNSLQSLTGMIFY